MVVRVIFEKSQAGMLLSTALDSPVRKRVEYITLTGQPKNTLFNLESLCSPHRSCCYNAKRKKASRPKGGIPYFCQAKGGLRGEFRLARCRPVGQRTIVSEQPRGPTGSGASEESLICRSPQSVQSGWWPLVVQRPSERSPALVPLAKG